MRTNADKRHLWKADTKCPAAHHAVAATLRGAHCSGLHRVELKELAQIPAREVLDGIDDDVRIERQEKLFA